MDESARLAEVQRSRELCAELNRLEQALDQIRQEHAHLQAILSLDEGLRQGQNGAIRDFPSRVQR